MDKDNIFILNCAPEFMLLSTTKSGPGQCFKNNV